MTEEQRNNPLHGVKLEALLTELVEHYGWEALASALNLNCFKSNPSIKSSLKFLRKTLWAREKVEAFYLYKYKRLPKPDDTQYALPPRDRTVPLDQKPRSPAPITAAPTKQDRAPRTEARRTTAPESRRDSGKTATDDVWSKWRKKDSD
ncbi:DUF2132 domain-containing protein [Pseudomaricurvus alcaniphilus]|nr:DUF2132 domain-containing protein [Pseudomaricurvus alcaniphilus]